MVYNDDFALFCLSEGVLIPAFVIGKNAEVFASLNIRFGEGLLGWVAQNNKLILNANPSVEAGYLNASTELEPMLSALVVPLEGQSGVSAALALYRAAQDAFTADDLRVLEAIRPVLGSVVDGAQRLKTFEASSGS